MTVLCTVGHSDLDQDQLIALLRGNGVSWVADVRSSPYSRRVPQFNRKSIAAAFNRAGIKYWFLGDKLGGKPTSELEPLWTQGRLNPVLVSELASRPKWLAGIDELQKAIRTLDQDEMVGCLMCSEKNPNNCHRSMIAFQLEEIVPDLRVRHLQAESHEYEAGVQKALFRVAENEHHYH